MDLQMLCLHFVYILFSEQLSSQVTLALQGNLRLMDKLMEQQD
jgi:hypothetical protein